MGVRLIQASAPQYMGTSADAKPNVGSTLADGTTLQRSDLPPGATFLEEDTGIIWWYEGQNWARVPTSGAQASLAINALAEAVQAMHRTLEMLRQGLINVSNCDDVNPADVATTPAEMAF